MDSMILQEKCGLMYQLNQIHFIQLIYYKSRV